MPATPLCWRSLDVRHRDRLKTHGFISEGHRTEILYKFLRVRYCLHDSIEERHTCQSARVHRVTSTGREVLVHFFAQTREFGRVRQKIVKDAADRGCDSVGTRNDDKLSVRPDRLDGGRLDFGAVLVGL